MGLILDTSEFISAERSGGSYRDVIRRYGTDQAFAVSVITVAELQHGVRRADGERRRALREQFLQDVVLGLPIIDVTVEIARRVGDLDATLTLSGQKVELADLIIAATALISGFAVATRNTSHFTRIPGLRLAAPL